MMKASQKGITGITLLLLLGVFVATGVFVYTTNPDLVNFEKLMGSKMSSGMGAEISKLFGNVDTDSFSEDTKKLTTTIEKQANTVKSATTKTTNMKSSYEDITDMVESDITKATEYATQQANPFTQTDSDYYLDIGDYLKAKEEYEEALENYEKYIELEPDSVEGYCAASVVYQEQGEVSKAIEYLQKALDLIN